MDGVQENPNLSHGGDTVYYFRLISSKPIPLTYTLQIRIPPVPGYMANIYTCQGCPHSSPSMALPADVAQLKLNFIFNLSRANLTPLTYSLQIRIPPVTGYMASIYTCQGCPHSSPSMALPAVVRPTHVQTLLLTYLNETSSPRPIPCRFGFPAA